MITHRELLDVLDYDPETGIFRWKIKTKRIKVGDIAGSVHKGIGHPIIGYNRELYLKRRLAWFYYYGVWPDPDVVQVDKNPANTKISNLREASKAQTAVTRVLTQKSGRRGVYLCHGKYQARVCFRGKIEYLGSYINKDDAARVYDARALELYGEFATTNASLGLI